MRENIEYFPFISIKILKLVSLYNFLTKCEEEGVNWAHFDMENIFIIIQLID